MKFSEEWGELILEMIMLTPLFMSVGILAYIVIYELLMWLSRSFLWL